MGLEGESPNKRVKSEGRKRNLSPARRLRLHDALVIAGAFTAVDPALAGETRLKQFAAPSQMTEPVIKGAPKLRREGVDSQFSLELWTGSINKGGVPIVKWPEKSPDIAEAVAIGLEAFDLDMAQGGKYWNMLHSETLTKQELNTIINQISHFSAVLMKVEAREIPSHPRLEKFLLRKKPAGFGTLNINTVFPGGELKVLRCGGVRVSYKGRLAFLTNRHCVYEKGKYGALGIHEWSFDSNPASEDIALRLLPEDNEPALAIHPDAVDAKGAHFAKFDIINRFDQNIKHYTYLIPVTLPVLRILHPGFTFDPKKPETQQVFKGYWYPAPPSEQNINPVDNQLNAKGQSGTPPLIRLRDKGFYVLGGPLRATRARISQCIDNDRGVCTTIMYATSVRGVAELFDRAIENEDRQEKK